MFDEESLRIIRAHENEIDMLQQRLYKDQMDLDEAYQSEWADMNELIHAGQWDEEAVFKGNCYGLKVGEEKYIFQLDAPLPFLPNTFYRSFDKTYKEFYAIKLMLSLQLRDVIEQIGDGPMTSPAALYVRHYYHNVRIFDLDNKSKQVLINTLRRVLLIDDTVNHLTGYREDAVYNESENGADNRTMIYLYPYRDLHYLESEVIPDYARIDNLKGVIVGKLCKITSGQSPLDKDNTLKREVNVSRRNRSIKKGKVESDMKNFM